MLVAVSSQSDASGHSSLTELSSTNIAAEPSECGGVPLAEEIDTSIWLTAPAGIDLERAAATRATQVKDLPCGILQNLSKTEPQVFRPPDLLHTACSPVLC